MKSLVIFGHGLVVTIDTEQILNQIVCPDTNKINVPGNIALGGGGGLLLFAGLSRLFAPLPLLVTLIVAISPVPVAVWFMGYDGMQ